MTAGAWVDPHRRIRQMIPDFPNLWNILWQLLPNDSWLFICAVCMCTCVCVGTWLLSRAEFRQHPSIGMFSFSFLYSNSMEYGPIKTVSSRCLTTDQWLDPTEGDVSWMFHHPRLYPAPPPNLPSGKSQNVLCKVIFTGVLWETTGGKTNHYCKVPKKHYFLFLNQVFFYFWGLVEVENKDSSHALCNI